MQIWLKYVTTSHCCDDFFDKIIHDTNEVYYEESAF